MACARHSTPRRIPFASALLAGLLIAASSARARAEPPPSAYTVPVAPPAPSPPSTAPAAPPPSGYALRPLVLAAPLVQYPTYVYLPDTAFEAMRQKPTKRVWYGWQTLIVLGSSATLGTVIGLSAAATRADGLAFVGMGIGGVGALFGGPIVHWAHGNTGKGFGALGLNIGVPVLSGGIGVAVACGAGGCSNSSGGFGVFFGLLVGGSLGLIGSMIIDVTALAYDNNMPVAATASRKAPGWTLVPDLKITREKTTFGFAGVF